jgi:peptidase E
MTKYILHGGQTRVQNEHNKNFYQEWVKDFEIDFKPSILLVYFSRKKHEWASLEEDDRKWFAERTNNRLVSFNVADSNLEVFQQQVKDVDVVYIRGGSAKLLINALSPIKDKLLNLFQGKVYAGSSAGVMVLCHFTRSHETDWTQGFGLLPINAVVHWSEKLQESLDSFKNSHPNEANKYILLPETEFIVMEA